MNDKEKMLNIVIGAAVATPFLIIFGFIVGYGLVGIFG